MNFLAFHREICYNETVLLQPCSIEEEVQDMAVSYKKLFKASIAKDPLMDVRVPEMVIKLKQGIGRLIRNFTDTGIVCIIDRRLRDEPPERYHDVTWASLPIKNKTRSLDELRNFYKSLPSRHDDVER